MQDSTAAGPHVHGGAELPGPQYRPLNDGAFCFVPIDRSWGGGYVLHKRIGSIGMSSGSSGSGGSAEDQETKWELVTDARQICSLTAAATALDWDRQRDGPALAAGGIELDTETEAHALSFLDCVSLGRSELASRSLRYNAARLAWTMLANDLTPTERARIKTKAKSIRSKDVVLYAYREQVASEYAKHISNMSAVAFATEGRLLSDLYPSSKEYDVFVHFSLGERVLCEGFFEVVPDDVLTMLNAANDEKKTIINFTNADFSKWPEMQRFLARPWSPWTDDLWDDYCSTVSPALIVTLIALSKCDFEPKVIFQENFDDGDNYSHYGEFSHDHNGQISGIEEFCLFAYMMYSAHHDGDADLNDLRLQGDVRPLVKGNLRMQPEICRSGLQCWQRTLNLEIKAPNTVQLYVRDGHVDPYSLPE